jgi:hypothetical protein
MATYTPATYYVADITADTDTTLVDASLPCTIATFLMSNTSSSTETVTIKMFDSGDNELFTILPDYSLAGTKAQVLDVRSLNVPSDWVVKVSSDGTGTHFTASGVTIS